MFTVNCFEEELSPSLCAASQVEVLSLNGLRAADGCLDRVVIPISGIGVFNTVGGTIPSCVWTLRNLTVLHLTGNGLSGELFHSLPFSSQFTDLSLSHNQLSGTIPLDFLKIANLDLSYNKLQGEYHDLSQHTTDSNISLEINRLSGQLPVAQLETVLSNGSLNILRGNMFSCLSVPDNDDYSQDYVCGSLMLNDSLFVFVTVIGSVVLLMVFVALVRIVNVEQHPLVTTVQSKAHLLWTYMTYVHKMDTASQVLHSSPVIRKIVMLSSTFMEVMRSAGQLLIVILISSLILYAVKAVDSSDAYATHSETYAWFWTLAYMRGVVSAGMLLVLWAVAIGVCFYRIIISPPRSGVNSDKQVDPESCSNQILTVGIAFTFNACVTITVNTLYIYSTQQALGPSLHFFIQLSLSIFRLVYIALAFPFLARPIRNAIANVRFRFILLTINNLMIPCVVTALTSDACFQVM